MKLGIAAVQYPTLNVTSENASLHAKIDLTVYVTNNSSRDEMAFVLQFVSRNLILMSNDTGWCACMSDFKDAEGDVDPYFNKTNNHLCGNVSSGRYGIDCIANTACQSLPLNQ